MAVGFHPEASEEVSEAAAYYEQEVQGLGEAFLSEIERAIRFLEEYPETGQPIGDSLRKLALSRFPYSLIYSLESDRIWMVAVAHQRRLPRYWQGRV